MVKKWSAGRQNRCFFYGQEHGPRGVKICAFVYGQQGGQTDGQQHGQKMVVLKTDGQTYGQKMVVLIFDGVKGGPP